MTSIKSISKIFLPVLLLAFISCKKTVTTPDPATDNGSTDAPLIGAEGFNYQTYKTVNLNIRLLAPDNVAIKNVIVNIYDNYRDEASHKLATFMSDDKGQITEPITVPAYMENMVIDPEYVGLIHEAKVPIAGSSLSITIGGSNGYDGTIIAREGLRSAVTMQSGLTLANTFNFSYIGTYSSAGVPGYLTSSEVIDNELLSYINASLPEYQPVPTKHPDYLRDNAQTNLDIVALSDVWVTFVTEGAGYLNSLAYYTYPTDTPPASVDQVKDLKVVFPNASLSGSGGGMTAGMRVKIGTFPAGTSVGFALVANGWNGSTRLVTASGNVFFADDNLNPETDPSLRRHTVLLYDDKRKLFLTGFEDLKRDGGSDNDFNDLIFYSKSNPVTGISTANVNPIDQPIDSDGDGVSDVYDKFPKDPTLAYMSYMPSENNFGTLAYEDLWPGTGDYDMNDLVVNYHYTLYKSPSNKTVKMIGEYAVSAIGASFENGFGVQFPFAPSAVSSVTGGALSGKLAISKSANGTEANQSKSVIIPFDNAYKLVHQNGGFVNTALGSQVVKSDTVKVYIEFTAPLDAATLGTVPFNPFLIVNGDRGREVHLPGLKPTDKANTAYFNTYADNTVPSQNKYYKTKANLPFAISFTEPFDNPVEKINIRNAYLKYADWVSSGGAQYKDWYNNKATGFRADVNIILK